MDLYEENKSWVEILDFFKVLISDSLDEKSLALKKLTKKFPNVDKKIISALLYYNDLINITVDSCTTLNDKNLSEEEVIKIIESMLSSFSNNHCVVQYTMLEVLAAEYSKVKLSSTEKVPSFFDELIVDNSF